VFEQLIMILTFNGNNHIMYLLVSVDNATTCAVG
jgi:hypothetical protein